MDLGIRGRKAIVAGGSAGLGYASARMLAAEGVELYVSARGADRLHASAAALAATGALVTPVVADHGTAAGRDALLAACPQPDIVIITCSPPRLVDDYTAITAEEWRSSLETTAIGPIELMKAVVPGMAERGFGRVVNIATVGVKRPSEARVLSGASRAALCSYAAAIAKKVARRNVAINNLLPGMFATPGAEALLASAPGASPQAAASAVNNGLVKNPMGNDIPADRFGEPDELAAFCALLCSRYAGFTVGQSWAIDGGSVGTLF